MFQEVDSTLDSTVIVHIIVIGPIHLFVKRYETLLTGTFGEASDKLFEGSNRDVGVLVSYPFPPKVP